MRISTCMLFSRTVAAKSRSPLILFGNLPRMPGNQGRRQPGSVIELGEFGGQALSLAEKRRGRQKNGRGAVGASAGSLRSASVADVGDEEFDLANANRARHWRAFNCPRPGAICRWQLMKSRPPRRWATAPTLYPRRIGTGSTGRLVDQLILRPYQAQRACYAFHNAPASGAGRLTVLLA